MNFDQSFLQFVAVVRRRLPAYTRQIKSVSDKKSRPWQKPGAALFVLRAESDLEVELSPKLDLARIACGEELAELRI